MSNYKITKDELLNKLSQGLITIDEYRILDEDLTNKMENELVCNVICNFNYVRKKTTNMDKFNMCRSFLLFMHTTSIL